MSEHTPLIPKPPTPLEREPVPPMTSKMLGRLFIVPALIVAMIVGSSVVVVLLFGWITTSREESIEKLVSRIEAGAGDKVIGVALLPRDKEVWQAAMELAERLQSDDPKVIKPEERPVIAERLEGILKPAQATKQTEMGQQMQEFLLTAVGRLGQPSSVPLLVSYATDNAQPPNVRRHALSGLVFMRHEPVARRAAHDLLPLLDSEEAVLRIAATVAIGALAEPNDATSLGGLTRAYRSADREVVWNATLALAQLGSKVVVPTLKDMLDRKYWEDVHLESAEVASPSTPDRKLTPVQVDGYLMLAMDAAQALHDEALKPAIEALRQDHSLQLRDHAAKIIQQWSSGPASAPSASTAHDRRVA